MRSKICGQSIQKFAIFIGFFYLLQSVLCSASLILNLIKYVQDKKTATAQGLTYDEDREVGKFVRKVLGMCDVSCLLK